jgi:hypothetical protein
MMVIATGIEVGTMTVIEARTVPAVACGGHGARGVCVVGADAAAGDVVGVL